jgi:hypothetical protein
MVHGCVPTLKQHLGKLVADNMLPLIELPPDVQSVRRGDLFSIKTDDYPIILYPATENGDFVEESGTPMSCDRELFVYTFISMLPFMLEFELALEGTFMPFIMACTVCFPVYAALMCSRYRKAKIESALTTEERALVDDLYWKYRSVITHTASNIVVFTGVLPGWLSLRR